MRLLSWNVNGLRALHRKGDWDTFLKRERFDILCLQETKAEESQLPGDIKDIDGYEAFFASSEVKKGYSGVALYTREKPKKVEKGIGIKRFDTEGRLITAYFREYVVLCVYFPNGGGGPDRLR